MARSGLWTSRSQSGVVFLGYFGGLPLAWRPGVGLGVFCGFRTQDRYVQSNSEERLTAHRRVSSPGGPALGHCTRTERVGYGGDSCTWGCNGLEYVALAGGDAYADTLGTQ